MRPGEELRDGWRVTRTERLSSAVLGDEELSWVELRDAQERTALGVGCALAITGDLQQSASELSRWVLGTRVLAVQVAVSAPGFVVWWPASPPWSAVTRDERRSPSFAERVLSALAALHEQGLAHGVLRPEFLCAGEQGIRVAGFGVLELARRHAGIPLAARVSPYAAPELDGPRAATPASDVFSVGCLVAEALFFAEPAPLAAVRAELSRAEDPVRALLRQALALAPQDRPRDPLRWGQALARALGEATPEREHSVEEAEAEPSPVPAPLPERAQAKRVVLAPAVGKRPESLLEPHRDAAAPAPEVRLSRRLGWVIAGALALMTGAVGVGYGMALRNGGDAAASAVTALGAAGAAAVPSLAVPSASGMPVTPPPAEAETEPLEPPSSAEPFYETTPDAKPLPSAPLSLAPSPPDQASAPLPLEKDTPTLGTATAPVTVVVFGDLEDSSTRSALRVLERAALARPGELRLAFRHRPLPSHARARETAELASAVYARRGAAAFWRFVSELARTAERISDASLDRALAAAGVTRAEVAAEVPRAEARVEEDLELATLFSVRGPQLFVNGRRVAASESRAALERTLAEERRRAVALIADGARPSAVYRLRVERELAGLGAAPSVRSCPTLGDSPRQGPADALLTVVEFSDFECPYSKRAAAYLEKSAHRSELALVWKAFPLNQHARAKVLASYALSALSRGGAERFWSLRSALFGETGTIDDAVLERISAPLGLDAAALIKDEKAGAHTERIARDVREGERFGVDGTPTFFVNGRRLDGVANASTLEHELGAELGRARSVLMLGVRRERVHALLCSREW